MADDGGPIQHRPTIVQTPSYLALKERFRKYFTNNEDGLIDHPVRFIADHKLSDFLKPLHRKLEGLATLEELVESAKLAKKGHLIAIGQEVDGLTEAEKIVLDNHRSGAFWREPKDLLLTLAVCCLASLVQGWDGVANGNLGWPDEFKIYPSRDNFADTTKFAVVQAVPWLSASILGSFLSDPLSEYTGRRIALFIAAACSFTSSVAGFFANTYQKLVGTRILLGLGIGGKASIVPVLLSEVLPSSNRGRLLVSWQTFDAAGVFFGSIACYILKNSWRDQILSGAIPAFGLLLATFASCESPRWLITRGDYSKAFTTLLRLHKERRLALGELITIQYQIQAERTLFIDRPVDDESAVDISMTDTELGRSSWWERLRNMIYLPRVRRAAIAAMVVMICQQLSGINIYAFLATQFYSTAAAERPKDIASVTCLNQARSGSDPALNMTGLCRLPNITDYTISCHISDLPDFLIRDACAVRLSNENLGFGFAVGFGAVNTIFSCVAYFLVENKEDNDGENKIATAMKRFFSGFAYFFMADRKHKRRPAAVLRGENNATDTTSGQATNKNGSIDVPESAQHFEGSIQVDQSPNPQQNENSRSRDTSSTQQSRDEDDNFPEYKWAQKYRGRRFLLLMSFGAGTVTLMLTSLMFRYLSPDGGARIPMIIFFSLVFTAFYSPGAGAIPFLYCAEVFPNEGREIGMSWSTYWNFLGAGVVAFMVPLCIDWRSDGHAKLLGIFSGLNLVAFFLVWFFVYTTNHATTLEDYSYVFGKRMTEHIKLQAVRLGRWRNDLPPIFNWNMDINDNDSEKTEQKEGADNKNDSANSSSGPVSEGSSHNSEGDAIKMDQSPPSGPNSQQSSRQSPRKSSATAPRLPPLRIDPGTTMMTSGGHRSSRTATDDRIEPVPPQ